MSTPKIFSPFVNRKPWATVIVALFFGPVFVMFYLGQGRKGLAYLLAMVASFIFLYAALHFGVLRTGTEAVNTVLNIAFHVVGALHGYFLGKRLGVGKPPEWFARWYAVIGLLWLGTTVLRTVFMESFNIPAGSMLPTLVVGDHLLVAKYAYGYSRHSMPFSPSLFSGRLFSKMPVRGDVLVFKIPRDNETDFIKRVIGLPGDTIQMRLGRLYINKRLVERRRLEDYIGVSRRAMPHYLETLPGGRSYRILEEAGDVGLLDDTPEFMVPSGHYFMLGDNRDNSADSRVTKSAGAHWMGYVPEENLIGRLSIVFWNSHRQKFIWSTPN